MDRTALDTILFKSNSCPSRQRRSRSPLVVCSLLILVGFVGCQSWFGRKKNDENSHFIKETKRIKQLLKDPERPRLIGEVAGITGLVIHQYDAYGLVTGLNNTGGSVKPGAARDMMLKEMRIRETASPEATLDALWTALVKVRGYGNPGDRDNQVIDVSIECSTECNASDLTGGFLLEARLREMVNVGGKIRESDDKAVAQGELVILPAAYTKRDREPLRAVIVGGGRLLQPRRLGLQVRPDFKHVMVTKSIEEAINKRFYFHEASRQRLMAEGKNDAQVALTTMPKYRFDASHFASVLLATGFNESEEERKERLEGCKKLVRDRTTVRRAAAELESLGTPEAIDVLVDTLSSVDTEIRFYTAYSLAYLDRKESVPVLAEIARKEVAFRPLCLVGLAMNEQDSAREALEKLLQESEPELRYGAFWALRQRDESDALVQGERLNDRVSMSLIASQTPLIAISLQTKQEIVCFGSTSPVTLTSTLNPTPFVTLTPVSGNQLLVTRKSSSDVIRSVVDADTVSLLRALGAANASYNDLVQTISQLSEKKCISIPVAFNPRPMAGRIYKRDGESEITEERPVEVDASSRQNETKSWWTVSNWFRGEAVTPQRSSSESGIDLDVSAKEQEIESVEALPTGVSPTVSTSSNASTALPEIDWDALN
ncbi:flagellar basal body P-ring protein [Pirellula sp. SH-Sr6A]|uniref:flagellar basal body P-ring protein FlgI n=1 Tax=Pirellula sp. SH-Sr6A TaxID=1632865 RepID=UPI00078D5B94|nr:flagellar basal body P-ring protein FlgI [Pirellula sp. SH-Sr6A]AMV32262.1 flagellar basal body P-ring protein [Pirellula sp. SH-Sr6A]